MTPRQVARTARGALAQMDLEARTAHALRRARLGRGTLVIAVGKAAPSMARGALDALPGGRAIVVAPDGVDARGLDVVRAAHPLPDRRSARAAHICLEAARTHEGALVVLVSGGASSLVCAPAEGVTLHQKRAVTRAMLRSGAPITAINVVRKHLSRIKGGGLLRAAARARVVLTLVASDVLGGEPSDVGSGPSVPNATRVRDARELLRRFAPRYASLPLAPTARGTRRAWAAVTVASPEELARVAARALRAAGLSVRVLAPSLASVDELADEYAALARRMRPGTALVRAAEPSLRVPAGAGRGGRSTHLAALVSPSLPRGAVFLALATDGVDGTSGTAGAVVTSALARRAGEALPRALAEFATGPLHLDAGTALPCAPTGHNLADLHVLVV